LCFVTRIELLFIYIIISHAVLDFGVKYVLRKFSSKMTRCTIYESERLNAKLRWKKFS